MFEVPVQHDRIVALKEGYQKEGVREYLPTRAVGGNTASKDFGQGVRKKRELNKKTKNGRRGDIKHVRDMVCQ